MSELDAWRWYCSTCEPHRPLKKLTQAEVKETGMTTEQIEKTLRCPEHGANFVVRATLEKCRTG